MRVALADIDSRIPNLALMKLSAYHKSIGDDVRWHDPLFGDYYDVVFASKVFTFTLNDDMLPPNTITGGSGYNSDTLPDEVEHIMPDYSLYGHDYSMGFLTRGCPRKCSWCIVPNKEGDIKANADIDEFLAHDKCLLMDNNVLASDHGIRQIEKIAKLGVKVDFNQGLDARLIDDSVSRLLSTVKWWRPIRLACDTAGSMDSVGKAVDRLRKAGATPRNYFCYVLVKDIDDALERVEFLRGIGVDPFAQPYLDFTSGAKATKEQRRFARWVNHKAIFKSVKWSEYTQRAENF